MVSQGRRFTVSHTRSKGSLSEPTKTQMYKKSFNDIGALSDPALNRTAGRGLRPSGPPATRGGLDLPPDTTRSGPAGPNTRKRIPVPPYFGYERWTTQWPRSRETPGHGITDDSLILCKPRPRFRSA